MVSNIKRAWHSIAMLGLFIRFYTLSFSLLLPLLGAAAVSSQLVGYQILGLIAAAMAFHIFAYVLNDVIDLPLDRTESLRAAFPLVRGTIQRWQALIVALAQLPLALLVTLWLRAGGPAYAALIAAVLLMAVYDVWGKRVSFPLFTDFIQGLGWGALVLYGAAVVHGRPSGSLAVIFAFVVVYIMMVNGIHGSLRDLTNDLNCGACTTAILLGARPLDAKRIALPLLFKLYGLILQALLIAILVVPLLYNWFGYQAATWRITASTVLGFSLLTLILLMIAAASTSNRSRMLYIGTLHIITSFTSLVLLFIPTLGSRSLGVMVLVYSVPLCSIFWDWLMKGIQKLRSRHL